ncbi:tetratricopeptide repeat protein [Burkholderia sp. 22PA0106]|uniref:tetratricopeptide repeat protein n=1 Tax=Burkholderia sp. 22PA0106 TaxID=3237371 RepID=UPI0039C0C4ED
MLATAGAVAAMSACSSGGGIAYKSQPAPNFDTRNLDNPASEDRIARSALQSGDLDVATTTFTRIVEKNPHSVSGLTGLGDTLYMAGDLTRAGVYYDKALAVDANAPAALMGRARVCLRLRQFDVSIASFRRVLELQPNLPLAQAGLGAALDLKGDHAEAQAFLRDALTHNPGDPAISINLGMSLIMAGRARDAVDVLTDVTRFPSAPPQAAHDLALAYGMLGNTQAASELLSRDLSAADVDGDLRFYQFQRERRLLVSAAVPALAPGQAADATPFNGWGGQSRLVGGAPAAAASAAGSAQ